jgi:hypothetical protein
MKRRVRNGLAVVVGLLLVYYGTPVVLAIISLGEICAYSPAGIDLCGGSSSAPTTSGSPTPEPIPSVEPTIAARLCKHPGVRYKGTTREGAEVCFTLTPDRSKWVEIGFRFVPASGCPHAGATGMSYYEGSEPLTTPERISVRGFTATIQGAQAEGVLEDSTVCGNKTFKWTAHRAP